MKNRQYTVYTIHIKIIYYLLSLKKRFFDLSIFGKNRKKGKISRRFEYLQQNGVVIQF